MKKLFGLLYVALFAVSLVSCGGNGAEAKSCDDEPANKVAKSMLDSVNFSVDGLVGMIKSDSAYTEDEYRALILARAKEEIDTTNYELKNSVVDKAMRKMQLRYPENYREIHLSFIKHENPIIRSVFIIQAQDILGITDEDIKVILDMVKEEKHPYVLINAIKSLSNDMKNPEVAKFVFAQAKSGIPAVRRACVYAICNGHSVGVDGTTAAAMELIKDTNADVRKAAMKKCGELGDDAFVPELAKILNDASQSDFHSNCAESLYSMWYDYPFHKKTSEAAYKATVDYLSKTPRNDKQPDWIAVGGLKVKNDDKISDWKKRATYFDQQKFMAIMKDIINDPNTSYNAKNSAKYVVEEWAK